MEHEFHQWIKKNFRTSATGAGARVIVGPGDDAAVLHSDSDRELIVATDTIAEDTHFELPSHSLELVGRKALAVNLSDIAAMGSKPDSAVLNFVLPKHFGLEEAKQIFRGADSLARQFNLAIVGGDSNRWDGKLVVGATVLGSRPKNQSGWSLAGAKAGDAIVVTGEFGGSIHGRHLGFNPRVELGLHLANNYQVNGATDASDSLSLDLGAMLRANPLQVGADLDLSSIPISNDVQETEPTKRLNRALTDGEDFELILSIPPDQVEQILSDPWVQKHNVLLTRIGTFTGQHDELRATVDGKEITIKPQGYIH